MELIGEKREKLGKQSKSLIFEGKIPAVIFGKKMDSESISIDLNKFNKIFTEAGETTLVDLKIDSKNTKVLINEVQHDPISLHPIHVSFYKPDLTQKTQVEVPVEYINAELNPLVKTGEAIVLVLMPEIKVEALPSDLPSKFEVDVTQITEIGAGITVGQLSYDKETVELIDVEMDDWVIKLDNAEMAEEPEEVIPTAEAEAAAIAQMEATGEKVETEEGAEGESPKENPSKE